MRKSTIKLTKKEFDFITSKDYPIIKRKIIQNFQQHFNELGDLYKQKLAFKNKKLISEFKNTNFKITRGDNYQSLPYVVLDYPQIKGNDFTILCRTMFWWGKYISLNVFIKTDEFDIKKIADSLKHTSLKKIKLYDGKDKWQQNLSDKHFVKLRKLSAEGLCTIMQNQQYVKLSIKLSFKKLNALEDQSLLFYNTILNTL